MGFFFYILHTMKDQQKSEAMLEEAGQLRSSSLQDMALKEFK